MIHSVYVMDISYDGKETGWGLCGEYTTMKAADQALAEFKKQEGYQNRSWLTESKEKEVGLFILNTKEKPSAEDLIKTAQANINLFLKENNQDCTYLLSDFALTYLDEALKKLKDIN